MTSILVTGGTGALGRPTVEHLRDAGHSVRVLGRKTGAGLTTGDLTTGAGVRKAVEGADLIFHLATGLGRRDVHQARTLLAAAPATHIVFTSIVGVDRIPLAYYRAKLEVERLLAAREAPSTILRVTQFYNLLDRIFSLKIPFVIAPAVTLQPIAVEDVARRLTELAAQPLNGRAPDIGGPDQTPVVDLAREWAAARGSRRPIARLRLPGQTFAGYRGGAALVDGPPYGSTTFADYLAS
ncbi:NAD(P)H-binding protein [Kribbella sandramycini]|uniref:NAD(P)H-binding protein n=1 Tax=Kribbella sandramycini TaxID=60450 RepID=A0A7Y4NZ11_9ACTN|nr:NAD(P)H-binding protein [Kribbella sandramycini]MBB6567689.1 uncharacterized protein YbjT (DUF2867 family) [Kribbella sandramycini]NOL39710.1 NAD(P)H-binding protein [Kribbella sandramycini]